jgi:hypothetical protein
MKLSLTGFQKVKSEGNTTTLKHPAGHSMTINHTILSPKLRGDIAALPSVEKDSSGNKHPDEEHVQKLADGGETEPSDLVKSITTTGQAATYRNEPPPSVPKVQKSNSGEATNVTPEKAQQAQESFVQKADGGEIKEEDNKPKPESLPEPEKKDEPEYKEGNAPEGVSPVPKPDSNPNSSIKDLIDSHKNLTDAHNAIVQSLAGSQQPQSQDWQGSRGVVSGTTDPTNITANATPGADQSAAGQSQQPSVNQPPAVPAVVSQPGSQTPNVVVPGYNAPMTQAQQDIQALQSYSQDKEAKNQQLFEQVSQDKIDPNRLYNNASTGAKIGNAIGLLLGGLGAGRTGGKNLAVSAMNDAIERDVDAQKANMAQGMNLYKMNLEATHNEQEARAMTINQQLTLAQAAISKQAASTQNATALQNLQKGNEEIKALKLQNDMGAYKAKALNDLSSGSSTPQQNGIDQKRFNELKLSGVMPKEDITAATKEAQNYQEAQKLQQDMEGSAKHLDKQIGAGILTPSDRNSAINAFAGRIAKIAEGRFNLEESKLQAAALLPSPGDLPSTVKNKAQRRAQFFDSLTPTTTLEGYGLKAPSQPDTETKTMNGVQYKKVNGGWQKQ